MAFATSPGHPTYTGNFIPVIWSGKLIENFYDATVLSAISNTDYEGEIRNMGDTVNIRTTPEITIKTYVKGQTLAGITRKRPDSGQLASSRTVPISTILPITFEVVSASGVPATPRSISPEIAPADVPLLLACTSGSKSVNTL